MKTSLLIFLLLLNSLLFTFFTQNTKITPPDNLENDSLQKYHASLSSFTAVADNNINLKCQLNAEENILNVDERISFHKSVFDTSHDLRLSLVTTGTWMNYPYSVENNLRKDFTIEKVIFCNSAVYSKMQFLSEDSGINLVINKESLPSDCISDTITIQLAYTVKLNKLFNGNGFAVSHGIYLFSNWFFSPLLNNISKRSSITLDVKLPQEFEFVSSCNKSLMNKTNSGSEYLVKSINSDNLVWMALKGFNSESRIINAGNHSTEVSVFFPNSFAKFLPRYFSTIEKSVSFLNSELNLNLTYPLKAIVCSDTSAPFSSSVFRNICFFSHKIFPPTNDLNIERNIISGIISQFKLNKVAETSLADKCISLGANEYLTNKILSKEFTRQYSYFTLFNSYPVRGISLLNLQGIPLVYSLATFDVPLITGNLEQFYDNSAISNLTPESSVLSSPALFKTSSLGRAALYFHTLDNLIGERKTLSLLSEFYLLNYSTNTNTSFTGLISKYCSVEKTRYAKELYETSGYSDYAILEASSADSLNYDIKIGNYGNLHYPVELFAYTLTDTITIQMNPQLSYQSIHFSSKSKVSAFEIDPRRQNLFDVNFSNNSFSLNTGYNYAFYLSLRWFYWMQSLLLIFGGLS